MSSVKPFIGCKIGLISRAQNRYEGILYTIDKVNSTVVLAKVKCFGTEGRPTDRPTPPKDDIYEYITFRGSDIKDIALCELPRSHHGLPPDPAIVQSSSAGPSGIYSAHGPFSPLRMPTYNQLAANSLLNQQYAAALGLEIRDNAAVDLQFTDFEFGNLPKARIHSERPAIPGLHVRRAPMVEKAVQTLHMESSRQERGLTVSQEQDQYQERRQPQRTRREGSSPRRATESILKLGQVVPRAQQERWQQNDENRPPPRRRQVARRRRNRSRGQLTVVNTPSATLKFDTDFDFDSSNAQFIKEKLEREGQDKMNVKGATRDVDAKLKDKLPLTTEHDQFGPKCYYDKAKSFFDNISSDNKFRLTWAEERKLNLETFGVPGRFLRGRGLRGGYMGARGRASAQMQPSYRSRGGQQ